MTSISLNIAGKIDSQTVAVLETVSHGAASLNLPYVVVGATARDLVLHYGHGAKIQRATHDIDFAIEVPDWSAFSALKDYLCESGFRTTNVEHRLIGPADTIIDIVPFGDVEDHDSSMYLSLISRFSGNLSTRRFELSTVETRHGSGLPASGGVNTATLVPDPQVQGSDKLAGQLAGTPMRHKHDIFSGCCIPSKISALRLAPVS